MENLRDQAQQIDNPNTPRPEKYIINITGGEQIGASGGTLATPTTTARARELDQSMGPQIQGEFLDFDPRLDRGILSGDDQNEIRAQNQTGWDLWKAGTIKVVSELSLGTLEATALMADFDMHLKAFRGIEQDFSNSLSSRIAEIKQEFEDKYAKVYTSKEDEGFSPFSGSWWANNAGSVASAVTLMIPSTLAIKGASAVLRSSKAVRALRLTNTTKAGVKGISSALVSRLGENAMEAAEAVEEVREFLKGEINPNTGVEFTEQEINQLAGEAGRKTWSRNWWMIVLDAFQYAKIFKGIDYARRTSTEAVKKSLASKVGGFIVKDMGGEGFEEGYQFIASQESQLDVKRLMGEVEGESSFLDRLSQYIIDDDFKTSVLLGAIGGGIFSGVGQITTARGEKKRQTLERLRIEDIKKIHDAAIAKSAERFDQAEDQELITNAFEKAKMGELDSLEADLQDLYYESDEALEAEGRNPAEYRAKVKRAQELIKTFGKEYNKVQNEDIDPELKDMTVFSRMDRRITQQQRGRLNDLRKEVYDDDLEIFKKKEESTASDMVRLKTLMHNKNIAKASELAKHIVEVSDKYKTEAEVRDAINTVNDSTYAQLDKTDAILNEREKAAEKFENDLKTKAGQERLKRENKARAEKILAMYEQENARKAKNAEEEAEGDDGSTSQFEPDMTKWSPEQKAYHAKRQERIKEVGEYDPGTPDGKKVFTTSDKKTGEARTWVAGEKVRGPKGEEYTVIKPSRGKNGAVLMDSKGNYTSTFSVGEVSLESKKPGRKDWTVNKFVFDPVKKRQKQEERQSARAEKRYETVTKQGLVKTSAQEFENYRPALDDNGKQIYRRGNPVWQFEPIIDDNGNRLDVSLSGKEWFPINYTLAALPLDGPIDVEIVLDTSKDKDAIIVKQGGENVAMIFPKGMETEFNNLLEYLSKKGGTIKARIIKKEVTPEGNLGNVKGRQFNLNEFKDSPFLPQGKIFIGSRKPKDKSYTFVAKDGSKIEVPVSETQLKSGEGVGNTYMLLLSPNNEYVPVQLNEATLDSITIQDNGREISIADKLLEDLENEAVAIQTEFNARVAAYVADGSSIALAKKRAKKEFGFAEVAGSKEQPIVQRRLKEILDPFTRMVESQIKTKFNPETGNMEPETINGRAVRQITKNYFRVRFILHEGEGAAENSVGVEVVNSEPNPDKGSTQDYVKRVATSREESKDILGSRFMRVSVDSITGENGGDYVSRIIDNKWVSTDVNPTRPWVNTRLVLKLDSEAQTEVAKGIAKPKATKSETSKSKPKTSKKDAAVQKDIEIEREERMIKARLDSIKINDYLEDKKGKSEYTQEQFVEDNLQGFITPEEFTTEVSNKVAEYLSKEDYPDNELVIKTAYRMAFRDVYSDIINNMSSADLDVTPEVETNSTPDTVLGTENQTQKEKDSENTQQVSNEGLKSLKKTTLTSKKKVTFGKVKTSKTASSTPSSTSKIGERKDDWGSMDALTQLLNETTSNNVETLNKSMSPEAVKKAQEMAKKEELKINCKKKK